MSYADSDKEAKWIWFDGNTWQSYDLESNHQIENAYIHGDESMELNSGPMFGTFPNVHRVYFNYTTNPPSFTQINVITKDIIHIKRTLLFKQPSRPFITTQITHDPGANDIINNHQNHKKTKKRKKKSATKPAKSSLLSNIQRIQLYKHLYTEGYNKQLIDKAIKTFNLRYTPTSPILNDLSDIITELTDIIGMDQITMEHVPQDPHDLTEMNNGYHSCDEEQGSVTYNTSVDNGSTPPSLSNGHITFAINEINPSNGEEETDDKPPHDSFDFKIGAWIEVNINNNWIPGKIIDVNWSSRNPVQITIGYQDVFSKRSKQIKLNGSEINRERVRPLLATPTVKEPVQIKKSRFNFDENDNWRRRDNNNNNHHHTNGTTNGRFNRNNLSIHKFSFEYHKDNKKYDEKNAKHPSEYINRKCFKCKGSGKCQMKLKLNKMNGHPTNTGCVRCKSTGYVQMTCTKCINGSGIYRKSHSLIHSKCNGHGCPRCSDSGKYPLHDILCNNCKGSGVYKIKCTVCSGTMEYLHKENERNQRYNQCMSGYRLPQLIPFVPKRENRKLSVHGASTHDYGDLKGMHNMKRLYHATGKRGADGIIETGVMFRGGKGEGIMFTDNGRYAEMKARENSKGYVVIADVFIGKCKDEYYVDNEMTFSKLHAMGYDSIRAHLDDEIDYVVYNWDQVWVHVVLPYEQVNFNMLR
eukprot:160753_1